jgi:ribonuclease P protein component
MNGPKPSHPAKPSDARWGFVRLTKRAEFQRVARGRRGHARCLALQAEARRDDEINTPRIGLTITRKVGHAVERNRIRRRMRAALKANAGLRQSPDHDYVVVARREALEASFSELCADLAKAFDRVHRARDPNARAPRKPPPASLAEPASPSSEPLAV